MGWQTKTPFAARYDLPGEVIVYPAITYAHKNHSLLIEAIAGLRGEFPDLRLVLLGKPGPGEQHVMAAIAAQQLGAIVRRPGRIPDADRDGMYQVANVLAFPSKYEGFGVPVLEAMVHGCPVVASNTTALPEAVGDAGLLVDPNDLDGWTAALRRVLTDRGLADELRRLGRERARVFAPAATADALASAYRSALRAQPEPRQRVRS